jgi:hypothetical protein
VRVSGSQPRIVIWLLACRIIKRKRERDLLQITAQTMIEAARGDSLTFLVLWQPDRLIAFPSITDICTPQNMRFLRFPSRIYLIDHDWLFSDNKFYARRRCRTVSPVAHWADGVSAYKRDYYTTAELESGAENHPSDEQERRDTRRYSLLRHLSKS